MRNDERNRRGRRAEAGFALVLAILALMLLTFLGLSLAVTTSTELQIATNYRWSQQALFNALAGIEIGKRYLQEVEWNVFLPAARALPAQMASPPPAPLSRNGAQGEPSRNFENWQCDVGPAYSGQGYGVVLDSPNFASPFQNTATFLGQSLNGSFTIWVRRPIVNLAGTPPGSDPGPMLDFADPTRIEMTVEGVAPSLSTSNAALTNRAVRYVTLLIDKFDPSGCENYTGQQGSGPSGSGYDPCSRVDVRGLRGTAGGVGETAAKAQTQ
jgi:PilX N-terminal